MNLRVLNSSLEPVERFDIGSIEYPYQENTLFYIENKGDKTIYNLDIEVADGLSIANFSTPPMIEDAYIISYELPMFNKYYEFIMSDLYKLVDIANFPTKEINMVINPDGYCRNIITNMAIKFYHPLQQGNSRIYVSEAKYLAGLAKDVSGSPDYFEPKITIDEIAINEQVPVWFQIFLKKDMTGERNPRVLNLLMRGQEYNA